MHALKRRFPQFAAASCSSTFIIKTITTLRVSLPLTISPNSSLPRGTLFSPWSAVQFRGAKVLGIDVRPGNVIRKRERIYQVVKAQHTQQGRGGATIQDMQQANNNKPKALDQDNCSSLIQRKSRVQKITQTPCKITWLRMLLNELNIYLYKDSPKEHFDRLCDKVGLVDIYPNHVELRDVDTGNKMMDRFRTDQAFERVFVQDKSFTYLYTEGDFVVLMDPTTFEQTEVSKDLFGKNVVYLKDEMKVTLQCYDEKPMSASVPPRVTCTVTEAKSHMKGLTATPQYKRVLLDNGLTMLVPPFIEAGDEIIINTIEDSYITRAKE